MQHFDTFGICEWQRLEKAPADEVSLYLHTHYLYQYVSPSNYVLEVGAGAGRFTQVLANRGARVLVADISSRQLEINKRLSLEYGFASSVEDWRQTDVCDLSQVETGTFDCVVAYGGPFSYVLDRRDVALHESLRILQPGGTLLLSVMSLWGSAHRCLEGTLAIPAKINQRITQSGDLSPITFPERKGNFMHLFRATELRQWLERAGALIVKLSASNCLSLTWDETLKQIRADSEKWAELLRMELEACADDGCLNMGTHIIAVAKKP